MAVKTMIRSVLVLKLMGITPKTVIHVGGHLGQDQRQYELLGVEDIYWCEADELCAAEIRNRYPKCKVITGLFWSEPGEAIDFWLMKDRAQNSTSEPKDESRAFMKTKKITTTLDKEFSGKKLQTPVMLVLDVQGAEIEVLLGALELLEQINYLICEITGDSEHSNFVVSQKELEKITCKYNLVALLKRYSHTMKYYDVLLARKRLLQVLRILVVEQLYFSIKKLQKILLEVRKFL